MLLRASGEKEGNDYDLNIVTSESGDGGVLHGALLRELTEAAIGGKWRDLAEIRTRAAGLMGEQSAVDTLTVASAFNGITRVADSTGIPLDPQTEATTHEMRNHTGIAEFEYARKSARYSR
jgi:hypothetical protein|tara:strand:+ start:1078 stop:1440 length:363 start_codon:yes stop_codon:yes gene_type:complete